VRVAVDILPHLEAGGGRWQRETVWALCSTGGPVREVTAFSFGKRYPRPDWIPPTAGYRVNRLPGRVQLFLTGQFGLPVEWVCRLGRPDVVLEMNLCPLPARASVILAVADVSWRRFAGQYRSMFTARQVQLAERAIRAADHILTLSRYSADELTYGGIPDSRITVIPLGVGDEFRNVSAADVEQVRSKYRLPERFVLYVGGINERKNLQVLAIALDRMSPPPPLVLAGPLPAEPLGFWGLDRPWIQHLGYVPDADMPGLYTAATLKVFPSKLEGFGLPLAEAMAAGTPVIASDIPVFREVGGDAVCFFPPDDPAALADLIRTGLESPGFRDEYRSRGRAQSAGQTRATYRDHLLAALGRAAANGPKAL
jgi:glycosyltransferase involved in cell wall biosynthesis